MSARVAITAAARTPMAGFQGEFSQVSCAELGGAAIGAVRGPSGDMPEELLMGCVLPAGQGQAPARQAGFAGGLDESVPAVTLNKMCGSGMAAIAAMSEAIGSGRIRHGIAGGMESMTNAPYLLPAMRGGARIGHGRAVDHMFLDGLEDAYDKGRLMGTFAEDCADHYQFTREAQDEYAIASLTRARRAQETGAFEGEIVPVKVTSRKGETVVETDEQPRRAMPEKIPYLKPAFRKDGTVTPANASSISDGAAALALSAEDVASDIRARIIGFATHAQAPGWFTTAPVPAAKKLLDRLGWKASDVDLWEVNEAFAVVPMAFMRELGLSHDVVNVNGGACALGHPIGASGARIVVTLLHALERHDLKRGVAAICIGGGEGMALAIERP